MKKAFAFIGIVILLLICFVFFNRNRPNRQDNRYETLVEKLKPTYSELGYKAFVKDYGVFFEDENDNSIVYDFYEGTGKINYISIHYNLKNNVLDSDETIKSIEDLYNLVTGSFYVIKDYFEEEFLFRDDYSMRDVDRQHLRDLLDYKEEYADWDVSYRYNEEEKSIYISYGLDTRYDKEGYDNFSIYIS